MVVYRTFGEPDPEPSVELTRERLTGQDIGLTEVLADLVGTVHTRTESQEDTLRPLYKLAVADADRRTVETHEMLGGVVVPILNDLRADIGGAGGLVTAVVAELPAPARAGVARAAGFAAPPGDDPVFVISILVGDGRECPREIVAEGDLRDIDDPRIVVRGPMTRADAELFWLELQRRCEAGEAPPDKEPRPEEPGGGELPKPPKDGPIPPPAPPPPDEPKDEPKDDCPPKDPTDCFVRVPCPPAGPKDKPPKEPPKEPPEEEPDEEPRPEEPGGEGVPLPGERPKLPDRAPAPDCRKLTFGDPNVCLCIEHYVQDWSRFGGVLINWADWLAEEGNAVHDLAYDVRQASIGLSVLKMLSKKISYNDPTLIEAAEQMVRLMVMNGQAAVDDMVKEVYSHAARWHRSYLQDETGTIVNLYAARSAVAFAGRFLGGFLSTVHFSPDVSIDFRHILQIIDLCISYTRPIELPRMPDVENLWLTGEMTDDHAACLVRANGEQWEHTKVAWYTRRTQPTADDYLNYYYRNLNKKGELSRRLEKLGYKDAQERQIVEASRVYLPPPSDIVRFAVKDVFDPAKLGLKEMEEEFNVQKGLKELFDAQGMHDTEIVTKDGRKLKVPTALLYWIASYHEVSPTQVYEMLHRLRPDRVRLHKLPGQDDKSADAMATDISTVRKLLKEADYNPIWRDRLAAISYRVIGRIDIRRMYEFGVFGKPLGTKGFNLADPKNPIPVGPAEREVAERYEDLGSTEIDARLQALFTVRLWERQARTRHKTRIQTLVCELYSQGAVTREKAVEQLAPVVETADEAAVILDTCEARESLRTLKFAVSAIKRQYLSFQIDENAAKVRLAQAGVLQQKAGRLVNDWNLIKLRRPRQETAGEMCGWMDAGLIDRNEFRERLMRIGYERTHAERIVRKCETGILRRSSREVERIARERLRERRRVEAANAKLAKERVTLEERRLTKFLATRSEKHLIAWFNEGLISVDEIRQTLLLKQFIPQDADRWILTYLKPKT